MTDSKINIIYSPLLKIILLNFLFSAIAQPPNAASVNSVQDQTTSGKSTLPIRPGDPQWPVAWTSYRKVVSTESDFSDLKAHGVGLVSWGARNAADARAALETARRLGMKYHIDFPDVTENRDLVKSLGFAPVDALMIGGAFRGKAIDRHLFAFEPRKQDIVIEPPVYSKGFPYTRGSGGTGAPKAGAEKVGHYYPDMPAPVRAEIIIPLKPFDGRQHLKIIPAAIAEAPADTKLEADSFTPEMRDPPEARNRKLYRLTFDLSGMEGAMLDHAGVAVYWAYHGTNQYWMFQHGNVSARGDSTSQALRAAVRKTLAIWNEANGGRFPLDVVLAGRFGDECFYITGHTGAPVVSYPLWDYSEPSIAAFRAHAGEIEYPRTWGFPEVYGPDTYGWWFYSLHEGCAALCGMVRDEIAQVAPGLLLFRNTTRMGVFDLNNDHDGSGQELLTRNLDIVHLDPYPATGSGYGANIPRDMSYCAGLARRYHRLLIPWMQAHTYGGPNGQVDVSPEQVDRVAREQLVQGPDAIIWLGYGNTFPKVRPDSWERAGEFHKRLAAAPPPKPKADLAVLRSYRAWALSSLWENKIRNPADWMLQQWLEVWAIQHGQPYDVFELPPAQTPSEAQATEKELRNYKYIVSTEPRKGAWLIGEGTQGAAIATNTAADLRKQYEQEMKKRGWLK
ncbi:MAG: hypothetical protein NTX50_19570 [Candidatus Sumerlaeota bacterium]|nr:hypothetical protein [Candidatus Sumerlaeota bacterium]